MCSPSLFWLQKEPDSSGTDAKHAESRFGEQRPLRSSRGRCGHASRECDVGLICERQVLTSLTNGFGWPSQLQLDRHDTLAHVAPAPYSVETSILRPPDELVPSEPIKLRRDRARSADIHEPFSEFVFSYR